MARRKAASVGKAATKDPRRSEPGRSEFMPVWSPKQQRRALEALVALPGNRGRREPVQTDRLDEQSAQLRAELAGRVIGQKDALDALAGCWSRLCSGLRDRERPLLTALLLGPTGVGKTETARALAESLFGTPQALVRINCEEYAHGHEVAKLLGSPPGYVGADIEPLLSQQRIDAAHREARRDAERGEGRPVGLIEQTHDPENKPHSIVLFDEVEKAHPTLWNALLGALEEGQVTLGNNRTTDLTRTVILMTSNVGSREMSAAMQRRPVGFLDAGDPLEAGDLPQIARGAAHALFPAEFLNRFDEVLVYEPLRARQLERIFDKFLAEIMQRTQHSGAPLLLRVSAQARRHVLGEGSDAALGARPLRRAMERLLVDPLSRLLASKKLGSGDVVDVELEDHGLAFFRIPRRASTEVA